MTKTYGWAVDLSITKENDTTYLVAINLSLPGGTEEEDDWIGNDQLEESTMFNKWPAKNVFKPWNWENVKWKLFKKENNKWVKTDIEFKLENNLKKNELIEAIEKSLTELPANKWKPFDVQNTTKNTTLVHALAPLGFLPSDISSSLRMSCSIPYEKCLDNTQYAVFPEFDIDNQRASIVENPINELGKYVSCKYTQINGLDFKIKFYCSIEDKISKTSDWETLSLKQVELKNQTQIRLNLLSYLSPIAIWKKLVEKLISLNQVEENIELIYTYLIRSIGAGWDFSYVDKRFGSVNFEQHTYENLSNTFSNKDFSIQIKPLHERPTFETKVDQFLAFDFDENLKDLKDFLSSYSKSDKAQFSKLLPRIVNLVNDTKAFNQITIIFWLLQNKIEKTIAKNYFDQICSQDVLQTVIDKALHVSIFEPAWLPKNEEMIKVRDSITDRKLDGTEIQHISGHILSGLMQGQFIKTVIKSEIEEIICKQIKSFIKETYDRKPEPTSYDIGLKLKFVTERSNPADELFRGYAIGLQVGYQHDGSNKNWTRASWVTDAQLLINQKDSKYKYSDFLHETIGATQVDSQTVGYLEYSGNPILASRCNENGSVDFVNKSEIIDADGTDYIDYIWPEQDYQKSFPLLGYGLWYRGIAVPLGNAGEIFDQTLRNNNNITKLKEAQDVINSLENDGIRYLSQVAPSAPTVVNAYELIALQELSSETKAYAFQSQEIKSQKEIAQIKPVALLVSDNNELFIKDKDRIKSTITLNILPPIPSLDFYEKWLNKDIISANDTREILKKIKDFKSNLEKANKLERELKKKLNNIYKINFYATEINDYIKELKGLHESLSIHPAVEKIIVKVLFDGKYSDKEIVYDIKTINQEKPFGISIKHSDVISNVEGVEIRIQQGSFCKVLIYSAIPMRYFTDVVQKRFDHEVFKSNENFIEGDNEYKLFGPAEYWFEAAPNSVTNVDKIDVKVKDEKSFIELSIANADRIDATWLRGVEFQRHEWNWTGYPVTFPEVGGEFDKWLNSFVGVESNREEDNHILNTYFNVQNEWKIGNNSTHPLVVHQYQLPSGPRPAKYIAFSVRPKIRFSKWIKPDAKIRKDIESKVFANGVLAKGLPIDVLQERIPVPPLKWAIPLTSTYKNPDNISEPLPERTQNGNLLIFDEAFRRTDSLVRFGGIGDTIDIEVMGTRITNIHEFGVNPIFHSLPSEEIKLKDQTLLCDEPFGLTYDITRNAKVAQTGIVVRPELANGKWMLAKIRARRFINPDTLDLESFKGENNLIRIPFRKVGNSIVPIDFCIDFDEKQKLDSLTFGSVKATGSNTLQEGQRFLVTFHKADGQSGWQIGVVAQLKVGQLDFQTIDRVATFSDPAVEFSDTEFNSKTALVINENSNFVSSVRPLLISDYTDPIWLSFIGSFGTDAKLLKADKCKIDKAENGLQLQSRIEWNVGEKIINLVDTFKAMNDKNSSTFHALMVYEPVQVIYKTGKDLDGGRFIGFYIYQTVSTSNGLKTANFAPENSTTYKNVNFNSAYAYLITIQKSTAISTIDPLSPNEIIKQLFPELKPNGGQVESKIRITPEYLGPIKINSFPDK